VNGYLLVFYHTLPRYRYRTNYRHQNNMAAYRTRQDYDYDYDLSSYSSSERDLAVHDLILAESGRALATESALTIRPSERLVHRGSGTYERHDARAARYVPTRRETDMVTLSEAVRRFFPSKATPAQTNASSKQLAPDRPHQP
jgi:hypothetical protein